MAASMQPSGITQALLSHEAHLVTSRHAWPWARTGGRVVTRGRHVNREVWQQRSACGGLRLPLPSGRRQRQTAERAARAAPGRPVRAGLAEPEADPADSKDDALFRCLSADAEVSVLALEATQLVREAQRRHLCAPTGMAALGRLLMGTLLLAALKEGSEESVQVSFSGRGPIGQMTAIADPWGSVKGFVANPACDPPLKEAGKLDVGAAVGPGLLTVVRSRPEWREPYVGTVPIHTGEVAEDLAVYLADSEQINTALALGVSLGRDGQVLAARGFLAQVLPFCSEGTLDKLEENVRGMPKVSDAALPLSADRIIGMLLDGIGGDAPELMLSPKYGPCSVDDLKPRMLRAVRSLGPSDIRSLLEERGSVEVRCEFCAEVVQFYEPDLEELLSSPSKL